MCLPEGSPNKSVAIARKADDEAEILTFAVVPPCRNKGLGKALLQTAVERLRARGTKRLFLEVEAGNETALRLYRSCGAEPFPSASHSSASSSSCSQSSGRTCGGESTASAAAAAACSRCTMPSSVPEMA